VRYPLSRPRDVAEARSRALRWLTERGQADMRLMLRDGTQRGQMGGSRWAPAITVADPADRVEVAVGWYDRMLRAADLYWVSDDMTALAEHAADSLPTFRLTEESLPSRAGLVGWSRPITGDGPPIIAASWLLLGGRVWVDTWCDPLDSLTRVARTYTGRVLTTADRERARRERGLIGLDEGLLVPLDAEVAWGERTAHLARARATRTLVAAWLLMGQTLAAHERADAAPSEARRLARRGDPPSPVTTVALRREVVPSDETSAGSEREYRHRWLVRGHWRQQWMRGSGTHRPTWIDPHLKGPEGADLLRRDVVNVLRR